LEKKEKERREHLLKINPEILIDLNENISLEMFFVFKKTWSSVDGFPFKFIEYNRTEKIAGVLLGYYL